MHDLGAAYRASKRTKPLMDELAFHPYPARVDDPIPKPATSGRTRACANLDRIKQAVWDAFHGTAQPTFAERAQDLREAAQARPRRGGLAGRDPARARRPLHGHRERRDDRARQTQAQIYADLIKQAACDPPCDLRNLLPPQRRASTSSLAKRPGPRRRLAPPLVRRRQQTDRPDRTATARAAPTIWVTPTQVVGAHRVVGEAEQPQKLQPHALELHRGRRRGGDLPAGIFKARAAARRASA